MAAPIRDALENLREKHGDIDAFVAKELGYKDAAELAGRFAGEQVDAIALAIDNMSRGAGFITGDQTGIGKGRVNAAIIRWAKRNGKTPVFVDHEPGTATRHCSATSTTSGKPASIPCPRTSCAARMPSPCPTKGSSKARPTSTR